MTSTTHKAADSTPSSKASWPQLQPPLEGYDPVEYYEDTNYGVMSVPACMNYVGRECDDIYTRRDLSGTDSDIVGATWAPTNVRVKNARREGKTLDLNGFELLSSQVSDLNVDFLDQKDVVDRYYPHCERLVAESIQKTWGGRNLIVKAFDHNVRSSKSGSFSSKKQQAIKNANGAVVQNPLGVVHADYTCVSGPKRLKDLSCPPKKNDVLRAQLLNLAMETAGDGATIDESDIPSLLQDAVVQDALEGKKRFIFVNVWRNINPNEPVLRSPLACIDAKTMSTADLVTFKIHYTDRIGENYFVRSPENPDGHGWWYYPQMNMDEALLLKQWDSSGRIAQLDGKEKSGDVMDTSHDSASTFTVHSAFTDVSCPTDALPRESIEVRCVIILDDAAD
eukprot:CAMPEP_0198284852 /NCGR_PEP_ID=MMETSP1449-20131203/4252_1 /TAXON_ID=420275 /ORGANISM="Attheya septentrionalis, Strain CCMP2084" /LENGTH=393 /DNA_ID=CAMNT_0043982073 /DNA_START=107 /DNA_END=1288 /DNA_ORIENTATION=+